MSTRGFAIFLCLLALGAAADHPIISKAGGEGDWITERFTVRDNWSVSWKVVAAGGDGYFSVYAQPMSGTANYELAHCNRAESGTTTVHMGGVYRLAIHSVDADWRVSVEDAK